MPFSSHKIRVAVLRGGPSPEYKQSLCTGKYVLDNLPEEYEPVDVLVSRTGDWHESGISRDPHKILHRVDVVWNALHGQFGEDGKIQKLFEHFGTPYSGSSVVASSVGMNKILAKKMFERAGIKTPYYITASRDEDRQEVCQRFHKAMPFPIVIKPVSSGSSFGISIAKSPKEIGEALKKAFDYSDTIIAEEFIDGKEVVSGVIEDFRGEPHYSLLPTCNFTGEESKMIQELAVSAHKALGLRHFSQINAILHPKRGIFILEVNTLPKLHEESGFVQSLKSVGSGIKEFISHTLRRVLIKK